MRRFALGIATVAVLLVGACGGGDDDETTSAGATTTSADDTTTSTTDEATTTTASGPGSTVKPAGTVDPGGYGWSARASLYLGLNGKQLEFGCPPAGTLGSVYGTGLYTHDSYVCTAAVHAGQITQAEGGQVVIVMQPGQPRYEATSANGVTSNEYGRYDSSFEVVSGSPFKGTTDPQPGGYGWSANTVPQHGLVGQTFTYVCPPAGAPGAVYGTGTYTEDSSVCTAAVHAGKFTVARGGRVVVEVKAGQDSYEGSTANGITSNAYGPYGGSYSFVS